MKKGLIQIVLLGILMVVCFVGQPEKAKADDRIVSALYPVRCGNVYGYINENGRMVVPPQFSSAGHFKDNLAQIKKNGKYGFIDKTGRIIIDPQFDDYPNERHDGAMIVKKNGKYGYIDGSGHIIAYPQFDDINDFSEGLARIQKNGKYGFIDSLGQVVIEPQYEESGEFHSGLAKFLKDKKWGYVDKTGKIIIAPQFDEAMSFSEGLAGIEKEGKWGYIDQTGKIIIAAQFDDVLSFSDGMAGIKKEGKWGYIDKSGRIVITPQYEQGNCYAESFSNGMVRVKKEGKWGCIDKSGQMILGFQFEDVGKYEGSLAEVKKDGKWGFIDKSGRIVLTPQFEEIEPFYSKSGNLAKVKKDGKWGYVDNSGQIVIEPQFKYAGIFSEGLALVFMNEKWGYINTSGVVVIEPQFEESGEFHGGLAKFLKDKKWGFIDKSGRVIIKPQFDYVNDFTFGFLTWVRIGDADGCIDKSGKIVAVMARECGISILKNGSGNIIWPYNAAQLCREYKQHQTQELQLSSKDQRDWEFFKERFNNELYSEILNSAMRSLIHLYSSDGEMTDFVEMVELLSNSFKKEDPSILNNIGGIEGFKKRVAGYLQSDDDLISGTAAIVLAVSCDKRYIKDIDALLDAKNSPEAEKRTNVRKGYAALALGLMNAKESIVKIVPLLKSTNEYGRWGAARSLGYLKAKEYAKDIAALLNNKDRFDYDDQSAIESLMMMGVGKEFTADIAKALNDEYPGERSKAACYALAQIGAKQYASDIAKFIDSRDSFLQRDAIKALAIMGATEYAETIAARLSISKDDSLYIQDASIALGIMKAKQYAPIIARYFKDKNESVRYYAAVGLVLMDANEYKTEMIPIIDQYNKQGYRFHKGDMPGDVFEKINKQFINSLNKMKE